MVRHSLGTDALIEAIGEAEDALAKAVRVMQERRLEAPQREAKIRQLHQDTSNLYDNLVEKGLRG